MKKISILGSTGSIGCQTLEIVAENRDQFEIVGLAAGKNIAVIKKQIQTFHPRIVSVAEEKDAKALRAWLSEKNLSDIEVNFGQRGACAVACANGIEMVIGGMVGAVGLEPTLKAVQKGIDIGLANKETLVIAGALINEAAKESGSKILPVDSEHNAIFQAMRGQDLDEIRRIVLTASGGPFRHTSLEDLKKVTPKQALKHPNWDMGAKITIDSATMMNKGLEVIEAHFLFNMPVEKIDIVVHPQSIVHSMVEYHDGSVIAQLGNPDMRIPIGYTLAYPKRLKNNYPSLDLVKAKNLEFFAPDPKRFPAIRLAYEALRKGKTMPAVLNAANEIAIPYFLEGRITFPEISQMVEKTMQAHEKSGLKEVQSLEGLLEMDHWARNTCKHLILQT